MHRIRPDGSVVQRLTELDGLSDARGIPSDDEATLYLNMGIDGRTLIYRKPLPRRP